MMTMQMPMSVGFIRRCEARSHPQFVLDREHIRNSSKIKSLFVKAISNEVAYFQRLN